MAALIKSKASCAIHPVYDAYSCSRNKGWASFTNESSTRWTNTQFKSARRLPLNTETELAVPFPGQSPDLDLPTLFGSSGRSSGIRRWTRQRLRSPLVYEPAE